VRPSAASCQHRPVIQANLGRENRTAPGLMPRAVRPPAHSRALPRRESSGAVQTGGVQTPGLAEPQYLVDKTCPVVEKRFGTELLRVAGDALRPGSASVCGQSLTPRDLVQGVRRLRAASPRIPATADLAHAVPRGPNSAPSARSANRGEGPDCARCCVTTRV
jgi:hypothetical protein